MFDEIANVTKEKDRIKRKGYARINTNFGALNVELHCDKAPKTCYNWIMLAKAGKYDKCASPPSPSLLMLRATG